MKKILFVLCSCFSIISTQIIFHNSNKSYAEDKSKPEIDKTFSDLDYEKDTLKNIEFNFKRSKHLKVSLI